MLLCSLIMNIAIYQLHIPMLIGHISVDIMLTNLALTCAKDTEILIKGKFKTQSI
jgi:hypothetical protein